MGTRPEGEGWDSAFAQRGRGMRRAICLIAVMTVACGALAGTAPEAAKVAPELPVAGWLGGLVGLEDFRGQTTAVVFFNDSKG